MALICKCWARNANEKIDVEEIKDVGHAWDKTHRAEGWEADRKKEAYSMVAEFLRGVYGLAPQ